MEGKFFLRYSPRCLLRTPYTSLSLRLTQNAGASLIPIRRENPKRLLDESYQFLERILTQKTEGRRRPKALLCYEFDMPTICGRHKKFEKIVSGMPHSSAHKFEMWRLFGSATKRDTQLSCSALLGSSDQGM